jgi:dephospho-CoA kinase
MSLFLITGAGGTGKSEICRELKKRGYVTYDVDEDGLARWQHNETRFIHPKSSIKLDQRTVEFLSEHDWNVPRREVEELAHTAEGKVVFLCGSMGNEDELYDLFTGVFALFVDDEILKSRLTIRTNNDWGKQKHELEQTLIYHHDSFAKHKKRGDIVIDTNQPIKEVVDEILSMV